VATKIQQAGLFTFFAGTVSTAALTISSAASVASWSIIPAVGAGEFAAFVMLMRSRGMKYFAVAKPNEGLGPSTFFWFASYLLMTVAPWAGLRYSFVCLGGRLYALLIAYRLVSFAVVAYFTTGYFDELDEVKMGTAAARLLFGAGAAALLVGAAVVLYTTPKSHRWTWYSYREFRTGPEEMQLAFLAEQLLFAAETKDEQRAYQWVAAHPSYYRKEPVTDWLLSLDADTILFARSDKKLPRGTNGIAGNSLKWFFDESIARIRYFYKPEDPALQLVVAHLTALAAQIEEREPPSAVLLLPPSETAAAAANSDETRAPAGTGGGTVEQELRARIAALEREAELREAAARERDGKIGEMGRTIGKQGETIREQAEEIERLRGG
jgi:hypothetical protein